MINPENVVKQLSVFKCENNGRQSCISVQFNSLTTGVTKFGIGVKCQIKYE